MRKALQIHLFFVLVILTAFCSPARQYSTDRHSLDWLANQYVQLAFQLGRYDRLYIDAYFGPAGLKTKALERKLTLSQIESQARKLFQQLKALENEPVLKLTRARKYLLLSRLKSLIARVSQLRGRKLTFDQESKLLYNVVAPAYPLSHFQKILNQLDKLLPGSGDITIRLQKFRQQFIIPKSRLTKVLETAMAEARRKTYLYVKDLPPNEKGKIGIAAIRY